MLLSELGDALRNIGMDVSRTLQRYDMTDEERTRLGAIGADVGQLARDVDGLPPLVGED